MISETLLGRLASQSEVVPETAALTSLRKYKARHADLSISRITAAAREPEHADIVDAALGWAQKKVGKAGNRKLVAMRAVERLSIEFARHLVAELDGSVALEVDGRLAFKRRQLIDRTRALAEQLQLAEVPLERILFKFPATWEGIQAMEKLTAKNGFRCQATLVFGMHQLAAAADAGAAVIAPSVGRISDWHRKRDGVESYPAHADPGVLQARRMLAYLEQHGYASELMPGTFRSEHQALALARCPRVSLPPKLLDLLMAQPAEADAVVADEFAEEAPLSAKLVIDGPAFQRATTADPVTNSKLMSGVKNLSWAVVSQEKQLTDWISARQDEAAETSTANLFKIWDYDGDGYIDREEWSGTEEVFNALDRDNNGRISLEEMALGLGAPFTPDE